MLRMCTLLIEVFRDENGQGMVEYGLILSLISVIAVALLVTLGGKVKTLYDNSSQAIASVSPAS